LESTFGSFGYHRNMMYTNGTYPSNMMWAIPATGSSVGTTSNSSTVTPKK
jgi:hypothetical protein